MRIKGILYFIVISFLILVLINPVYAGEEKKVNPVRKSSPSNGVNINKALAEEIATLPGIGEKTAKLIVEYREKNGGFKKVEDIRKVKDVGGKLFEKIKGNIAVEEEKKN